MYGFIGFLVALLAALWVFSDARSRGKGRFESLLWLIGTLLLLIIFLPLWLFVRPQKSYGISVLGKAALCAHCGKYYEGVPAFCPNCGESLGRPKKILIDT